MPCAVQRSTSPASTARRPETTTASGPFTAAIDASRASSFMSAATLASLASTAYIRPSSGRLCINRARSTTRCSASSGSSAPATTAATYSPNECPSTTSGSMPQAFQSSARAYSRMNSAGCVSHGSGGWSAVSSWNGRTPPIETPDAVFRKSLRRSSVRRKVGCVRYSAAAASRWNAPIPVNRNARRGALARFRGADASRPGARNARRALASSPRSTGTLSATHEMRQEK